MSTPTEFKSYTIVDDSVYEMDRISTLRVLQKKLKNHQASFFSKEYFDSTRLLIDTIMYDSSRQKRAVFVLAENPTTRQSGPNNDHKIYYNAYCYLFERKNQADTFTAKWFNVFSSINFYEKKEIRESIRELYFHELSTIVGGDDKPVYIYNLDDKRFWNGPGWAKVFD